eukprot:PITA_20786
MSPFEVLYGRKRHTSSSWSGPEDRLMLGPEMLKEMEELVKKILARIGPVAYQLALPSHIRVHNVFHVSVLKIYVYDPKHVINWQDVQVESEGEIWVEPLSILDRREVTLWKWDITQVKVQWQHFGPEEATLKDEEIMRKTYPGLFIADKHRDNVQYQGRKM